MLKSYLRAYVYSIVVERLWFSFSPEFDTMTPDSFRAGRKKEVVQQSGAPASLLKPDRPPGIT